MSDDQNFDNFSDRVAQLFPTVSDMSPDELREHVRHIRRDRRKTKTQPKAKKAARAKSETKLNKMKKLLADNPALAAKLLGELDNGDGSKEG